MRHQSLATAHPPSDIAKTYPFVREDVTTTPFAREPVDADDTVPVELYSRPYERIDIQPDSRPYERVEIEHDAADTAHDLRAAPAPSKALRIAFTVSLLTCAFVAGFELAILLL